MLVKIAKERRIIMPKWLVVLIIVFALISLILIVVPVTAKVLFIKDSKGKVTTLFNSSNPSTKIIDKNDIEHLPYPVQQWLTNSNVVGKKTITTVRLKQKGKMRTSENGPWMLTHAEQYFTTDEPGFVWIADVKMNPFIHLAGIDTLRDGKGKMKIKILSLYPVVNAEGAKMNSATMMRYLAEMMWFPSAALSPYITWQEIDKHSAKATMEYDDITVSGVFTFNEEGDIVRFMGKRYREVNGKYVLCNWGGTNKEYKEFEGIRIPSKSDVTWFEEDGEFKWFEVQITELEYNKPEPY
jgi:hypothetical protein